jgi:RNA recognition motif-containing protein
MHSKQFIQIWSIYMKKKLFVGNLSWKATEDSLKPVFEAFGKVVSIKIITDHTGRSKGFGFVEMETAEDAENAIKNLNEKPHLDRNIRVSLAQERTDRPAGERREHRSSGTGGGAGGGGNRGGGSSSGSGGGYRYRENNNSSW